MKKFILCSLLLVSFALCASPILKAATIYAEGGVWNYGIGTSYVWSYYSHNTKSHASTAIGKYTSYSGKTRPGIQARASAPKAFWGNETYYKVY